MSRRACLGWLGLGGLALAGFLPACTNTVSEEELNADGPNWALSPGDERVYPAPRNPVFTLDRPLTAEHLAAQYNNFYEFSEAKDDVWQRVKPWQVRPWSVDVTGLVRHPQPFDLDDFLAMMPIEERLYRHRCVETWAMAVPWTGFPFSALIKQVEPLEQAKFVRLTSFHTPSVAPGQNGSGPWPYTEGLTMAEAMNELTLLATGIYGHPLPKQQGAPIRLITPWKYGYKSIKSIVRIEFVAEQPATFWNTLAPQEYDFDANVNPTVPHPRWSQRTERLLGNNQRRDTLYLNGYHSWVGHLPA
jgi:sulfoxide reductase catalytic subunit YedY